jgi:nucleotide-binding universal stress UspA family protein
MVGQQDKPVAIRATVVRGHPAQVLLETATGAYILVVGSRGHGTFAGMLLGSVSQHCVQHAGCPVLVVPQDTTHSR